MDRYPLTVFYDGACPICAREIALMRRLDRQRRLSLCDFSSPDYDVATTGLAVADLSAIIHARWADGMLITGADVFRGMWEAVGLEFLAKLSRLSFIDPIVLKAYAWFARNRLWLTGRRNACSVDACAAALPKPSRTLK